MAFNKDELIIDQVLSGAMFDKSDAHVLFLLNDISDPSLEMGGEKVYATDHLGMNIAAFNRSKTATFSGSNSLFSLGLIAAQAGTAKEIAGTDNLFAVPYKEYLLVGSDTDGNVNTTVTLAKTPITGSVTIELLDEGRSLSGTNIPVESTASDSAASISENVITLPTGLDITAADYIGVFYEYETDEAVTVKNVIDSETISGEFRLEVLFCEKCNQSIQYYGYVVFPSAVLDNNATINLTTDGGHPFTIEALADYCSTDRELFHIIVPGELD